MLGQDPSKYMITIFWKKNKKLFRVIFFNDWGCKLAKIASVITIFISNFGNLLSQKQSHVFFVICNNFLQSSKYITFSSKLFQCCFYFQVGFKFGRYFCCWNKHMLYAVIFTKASWKSIGDLESKIVKENTFCIHCSKIFCSKEFFLRETFLCSKKKMICSNFVFCFLFFFA